MSVENFDGLFESPSLRVPVADVALRRPNELLCSGLIVLVGNSLSSFEVDVDDEDFDADEVSVDSRTYKVGFIYPLYTSNSVTARPMPLAPPAVVVSRNSLNDRREDTC